MFFDGYCYDSSKKFSSTRQNTWANWSRENYERQIRKEKIRKIILSILTIFGIIGFIWLLLSTPQNYYHYKYIDWDGNEGIAQYCSYKFIERRGYGGAGGQGSPVCELNGGTVIQVKQYTQIYDYSCSVIDEIREKC